MGGFLSGQLVGQHHVYIFFAHIAEVNSDRREKQNIFYEPISLNPVVKSVGAKGAFQRRSFHNEQ